MVPFLLAIAAATLLDGPQASAQLAPVSTIKPGIARQGTLANPKLVRDTTDALRKALGNRVITPSTTILKFVLQPPAGKPGARAWREVWIVRSPQAPRQFLITFRESGFNAADFEIESMSTQPPR